MTTDLTARITQILVRHDPVLGGDECDCGWYWDRKEGRNHPEHVAALIAAEFRREERQIDYGLGLLGVEKRTQVRYVTSWETQ